MQNQELPPKKFLTTLSVLHLAFCAGLVSLILIMYVVSAENTLDVSNANDVLLYLVPVVAVAGFYGGNMMYRKSVSALSQKNTLGEKLSGLQTAILIRYAFLEAPALLGMVAYISSHNLFYLIISALITVYFFSLRPTKRKIETDLKLNREQRAAFNHQDQSI